MSEALAGVAATAPAPPRPARTAGIAGLGSALPARVVPDAEVAERLGVAPGWIERRTGIRSRRRLAEGERLADLAVAAARAALDDAGLPAAALDAVLVATLGADEITPGAAPLVAEALGTTAAAMDVNAACTGFLASLQLGAALVETGRADHVLVVGAEAMSRLLDLDDRRTAGLFGDGAGAAVVSVGAGELGPVVLRSDGAHAGLIVIDRDERVVRMEGQETFLLATAAIAEAARDACAAAGIEPADVDLVVLHQANRRITDAAAERLGVDRERVVDAIADVGNTSAASLPLALAEAHAQGRLRRGDRVLVGAMGAGFTYGAAVLRW